MKKKRIPNMSDPVTESSVQKGIIPDTKPVDEAPRRTDGVSQLCMFLIYTNLPCKPSCWF